MNIFLFLLLFFLRKFNKGIICLSLFLSMFPFEFLLLDENVTVGKIIILTCLVTIIIFFFKFRFVSR